MEKFVKVVFTVSLLVSSYSIADDHENFKAIVKKYETLTVTPKILDQSTSHINAEVSFNSHGRDFHLFLKTHKNLFSTNFRLQTHDDNGFNTTHPIDTRYYVTGYLKGEPKGSVAHGKVSTERFEGIIHVFNESYHIERIEKHFSLDSIDRDHNVVVYKASNVDHEKTSKMSCGMESTLVRRLQEFGGYFESTRYSGNLRRKRLADNEFNTCDVHVWADYEFFSNVGSSDEAQTLDEMAIHIMDANDIFRSTQFSNGLSGYGVAIGSADILKTNDAKYNPLVGTFTVEELLEAFASFDFDGVCLGHLFTYRDFQGDQTTGDNCTVIIPHSIPGTLGLAYLADPDGSLAGGICDKRTQTFNGELNLNTGLTSLITFGRKLPQAVSTITTTHELGHNFGSEHDPSSSGTCSPGGIDGNYIMYPTATDGNRENNRAFSSCSTEQIGDTISSKGSCFIPEPQEQECGNGIVEGDEECDCKYNDTVACSEIDPCCKPGECMLKEGAKCSPNKYRCCNLSCEPYTEGTVCSTGDECLEMSICNGSSFSCPSPQKKEDGESCNEGSNVCDDGVCSGSICSKYNAESCFCSEETSKLCDVCCMFEDACQSTFDIPEIPAGASIRSGFPCKDFTGYCDNSGTCIFVDTNTALNDIRNIIPSFTSIVKWLQKNWYWVLAGLGVTIILIILLQVTYRRKNRKKKTRSEDTAQERRSLTRHESATRL